MSVWCKGVGMGVLLSCASCVPLEDWSSYRSAGGESSLSRPSLPSGVAGADGSIPFPSPPLPDAASDAATDADVDAGSSLLDGGVALEPDASRASSELAGLESDAGLLAGPPLPGALVGESRHALSVAGVERSFIYYAPAGLDPNAPAPVLIVAHGFEETAADMVATTSFDRIADRERFVVLYPEGQGVIPWNIGDGVCQGGARTVASARGDDSAFIDAMLAFVGADRVTDADHVFMTGLGSGAYLASDLACRRSDIRAVVAHSGGSHALDPCVSTAKPVLLLHGTEDTAVPVACSVEARERWAAHNGCASESDELAVLGGVCELARGCPVTGQVTSCVFEGMGRGWAGGAAQDASFLDFESASELTWLFFETFAW